MKMKTHRVLILEKKLLTPVWESVDWDHQDLAQTTQPSTPRVAPLAPDPLGTREQGWVLAQSPHCDHR